MELDKEAESISGRSGTKRKNSDEPQRNCETMPRYYKDTWSPDRNKQQLQAGKREEESKSELLFPGAVKAQDHLLQLSPIQKTAVGYEPSQCDIVEELIGEDPVAAARSCVSKISVRGIVGQQVPPASYAIPLINLHAMLEMTHRKEFTKEVEYLIALALISGRRFIQACEILRKIEAQLLAQAQAEARLSPRGSCPGGMSNVAHKSPAYRLLNMAAVLELMVADCMNPHFQLYEKLNAFKRACELYQGMRIEPAGLVAPTKFSPEDVYTTLVRMHPCLTRLVLSNMAEPAEAQRAAMLKCLDFILENMGCSLGVYVIHILKTLIGTYPNSSVPQFATDSFNVSMISISSGFPHPGVSPRREHRSRDEAVSPSGTVIVVGEQAAAKCAGLYNHLLDTYVSVLSSISSQILQKLFYEILLPHALSPEMPSELKAILLKIADKIVSICQGDLVLNEQFLAGVMAEQASGCVSLAGAAQALWQTIKSKLCPNCSPKARKQVTAWVFENLVGLAEKYSTARSEGREDEEAVGRLATYIDLACVLTMDRQGEDSGSLVLKNLVEDKTDLYLLLNPLLFWLNYAMTAEGKLELFKQTWQSVSSLLRNMHAVLGIDITQIYMLLLSRLNDHFKHSSPTLPMLQFLRIVMKDLNGTGREYTKFLIEFADNLCAHIPNFPYEDIFVVFDQLLPMVLFPRLPDTVLCNMISAMIDRYTQKSKKQQESEKGLIQKILEGSVDPCGAESEEQEDQPARTLFDVAIKFCMTDNKDVDKAPASHDNKRITNTHERFIDRLHFLVELLRSLSEVHKPLVRGLISSPELEGFLSSLAASGHSSVRLRAHEILELLCTYYVTQFVKGRSDSMPDSDTISAGGTLLTAAHTAQASISFAGVPDSEIVRRDQLILGRLVLGIVRKSFENASDSYMQFNALILLDLTFQNLLPLPGFQVESQKKRSPGKRTHQEAADLESVPQSDFRVGDPAYLSLRMQTVLKLWPCVQTALNSSWSNIRSICYGLICSMLKVDVKDYHVSCRERLKAAVLPLLLSLLGSKESESKAGGLNILGSFCGLSYDVPKQIRLGECPNFFRRNSRFVSLAIWQKVFQLQEDWDCTIREAATVLIQLAAPKESVLHFHKLGAEAKKLKMEALAARFSNIGKITAPQLLSFNEKAFADDVPGLMETVGELPQEDYGSAQGAAGINFGGEDIDLSFVDEKEVEPLDSDYFYIEKYSDEQIKDIISIFRNDFRPPKNLWIEKNPADSLAEAEPEIEDLEPVPPAQTTAPLRTKVQPNELPIAESESRRFNAVDILEDKLVENMAQQQQRAPVSVQATVLLQPEEKAKMPAAAEKEKEASRPANAKTKEELRKKDSLDAGPYKFFNSDEEINQDDLEIIDLEDEDFLKSLEDDKVPVLKNTYADKKSKRPSAPKPGSVPSTVRIDLRSKLPDASEPTR